MEYEFEEWAFKSLDEITDKINDGSVIYLKVSYIYDFRPLFL